MSQLISDDKKVTYILENTVIVLKLWNNHNGRKNSFMFFMQNIISFFTAFLTALFTQKNI